MAINNLNPHYEQGQIRHIFVNNVSWDVKVIGGCIFVVWALGEFIALKFLCRFRSSLFLMQKCRAGRGE